MLAGLPIALLLSSCAILQTGVVDDPQDAPTVEPTAAATDPTSLDAYIVIAELDADGAHVTASGGVRGVIESDGMCEFVFAPDEAVGVAFTVTSVGISDVSGTSCGTVQADAANFTSGSWTVELDYQSASGTARSMAQPLEIP
jgi:hypothetical protein